MKTKKTFGTILAFAVTLSLLFSAVGLQLFTSVSAATNAKNLLIADKTVESPADGRAGSFSYDNGTLKLTATGKAGYGVSIPIGENFRPKDLPKLVMDVSSTAHFNIAFGVRMKSGVSWPSLRNDFFPSFDLKAAGPIPAGNYVKSMDFLGCYTWNNNLPDDGNSNIVSIGIALTEPGTLTVKALQFSDVDAVYYFTDKPAGDTKNAATPDEPYHPWAATVAPTVKDKVDILAHSGQTLNADGSFTVSNWQQWGAWGDKAKYLNITADLSVTPYLYYSINMPQGAAGTFTMYNDAPWGMFRDGKAYPNSATMTTNMDLWGDGGYVTKSETGCIKLSDCTQNASMTVRQITLYVPNEVAWKINYMFFGSAPVQNTTATTTNSTTQSTKLTTTTNSATESTKLTTTTNSATESTKLTTTTNSATESTKLTTTTNSATESTKVTTTTSTTSTTTKPPVSVVNNLIVSDVSKYKSADANGSSAVVSFVNGALHVKNSAGAWPAAKLTYDMPIQVNINDVINYDITPGKATSVILFFNGDTSDNITGRYVILNPYFKGAVYDKDSGDVLPGTGLKGNIKLKSLILGAYDSDAKSATYGTYPGELLSTIADKNGNLTITGMKVFATGDAAGDVVIRELSVSKENAATTGTETNVTTSQKATESTTATKNTTEISATTQTETEATTIGDASTTNDTSTTGQSSPVTGENLPLAAVLFSVLALTVGTLAVKQKENKKG